jgi:amidohydrolase
MANELKEAARERVRRIENDVVELSRQIHAHPELGFEEHRAASWLAECLRNGGLEVETALADMPTAFVARAGSGSLHIAFCAEYDCLPEMGHACGHNIIGAAAVGAGIAVAGLADALDLTVSVIGTPAEEVGNAGGKIRLLECGIFDDVDAAMMVHPGPVDVVDLPMLACATFDVRYRGVAAHASSFPERGVNAADALTIAQTSIGLLRQHLKSYERVHGIVTHGGDAPNVVPAYTSARYIVRSKTVGHLDSLMEKVRRCFEAGALASGSEIEIVGGDRPYAEMEHHPELGRLYRSNAEALGRRFPELGSMRERSVASTDMGNVSLAVPSIHPLIGIDSLGSAPHQPEFATHCASESADRAVVDGATSLAWTAIDLATHKDLRTRLRPPSAR